MIEYIIGSATEPVGTGNKIIAHVCNDIGAWGRGFVLSLTRKWPYAENSYRNWYQGNVDVGLPFKLGEVQLVKTHDDIYVANMIAQHGIFEKNNVPPIRYDALEHCLSSVRVSALVLGASVHMPRIGCGLAGGRWSEVEPIIARALVDVSVFVYDLSEPINMNDPRVIEWKQ